MERFLCLNCDYFAPVNTHGDCSTCGSSAVVSEHSHQTTEMFPGYYAWLIDAERTLEAMENVTFSLSDSKVLAGMGIKV